MDAAGYTAFNRTKLELKPVAAGLVQRQRRRGEPFNRTKLELKQALIRARQERLDPFNRTKLELKHNKVLCPPDAPNAAFNRTKLELKRGILPLFAGPQRPLIEPSWN